MAKTSLCIYRFLQKTRMICDRLLVVYKFKLLFGQNQKRKKIASKTDLDEVELIEIKKTWSGIKVKDYWFKWYKYINCLHYHASTSSKQEMMALPVTMTGGGISMFIPDFLYFIYFCPFFNDTNEGPAFDDKNMYDLYFPDVSLPETLFRKVDGQLLSKDYYTLSEKEAIAMIKTEKVVILKISISSGGGKGVSFIDGKEDDENIAKELRSSNNFVVQNIIHQHELLSNIHPSSINTIRIVTFYYHGKVHVLSGILRMGVGESKVDNSSSGGIFCGITDNGCLKKYAFNKRADYFEKHPTSGFQFEGKTVPGWEECKKTSTNLHYRLLRISKLISWDFAVGEDGKPILIEPNITFGDIDFHQIANGPLFGDMTGDVIKDVFGDTTNRRLNKLFY